MDSKDFRLLVALHEDGRRNPQELGRRVSLSAPAVRERLRRLEELGILQGYWLSVDPAVFRRKDLLVFFGGECSRNDAMVALEAPDVAWVGWKLDGGLTVKLWPLDVERAIATLTNRLHKPQAGWALGQPSRVDELSPIEWRVIDALIDDPRRPIQALSGATGLSPKTVRKHLEALTRAGAISIAPRLGSLAGAGDLVYHVAVHGSASIHQLRRILGDAVLIHETRHPPLKYLLCRANDLADLTMRTHAAERIPGIDSVRVMQNRKLFVGTGFLRRLTRERIETWKKARLRPRGADRAEK